MAVKLSHRAVTAVSAVLFAVWAGSVCGAPAPSIPWHLPEWKYRQVVELLQIDPSGKVDTGLIELDESPPRIAPDGADIRVLDETGAPVTFQVVTRAGEPLEGAQPAETPFRIHFRVAGGSRFYAAYFGNPAAKSAAGSWAKKLGGLTLETRANSGRTAPGSLRDMLSLLSQSKMKYGEGFRRQINDPENPFGPNEQFISIYRGSLYCPDDGPYIFATDSDDASFLLIDGQLAAQETANRRTPPGTFEATGRLDLKAGLHRIEYYHVQVAGGSLARAGWQPPGAAGIAIIPEDAFVRELLADPVIVESRESPVNAFFTIRTVSSVTFNNEGPVFTTVAFTDRSRSEHGDIALREWDFGDGDISREEAPKHVFEGSGKRTVTLRCTDRLGFESVFSREIVPSASSVVRVEAELEAVAAQPILMPGETPEVQLSARLSALPPLPATLVTELRTASGGVERYGQSLDPEPGKWTQLSPPLGALDAEMMKQLKRVSFAIEIARRPAASSAFEILSAADNPGKLRAEGERVLTESGQAVFLRLSEEPLPRPAKGSFARLAAKGGPLVVAVVDDSLAGEDDGGYPAMLVALVRARYPNAQLKLTRIGLEESASPGAYNPLAAAVEYPAQVAALKPDVVVLAASLRDVLRLEQVERFERNLQALVERAHAATDAQIVLIAPPPVIVNPALSQAYALAVKRVGLRKNVQVADAYSAFICAGEAAGGWRALYRDSGSGTPLYHVAPAEAGQKLIAETLFRAMEKE